MRPVWVDLYKRTRLDRFLSMFATVHSGEGLTALLLMLDVFLLLTAYYIIKPVREAVILEDALSAVLVFAGTQLAFSIRAFALINAMIVLVWLAAAMSIVRIRNKSEPTRLAAA